MIVPEVFKKRYDARWIQHLRTSRRTFFTDFPARELFAFAIFQVEACGMPLTRPFVRKEFEAIRAYEQLLKKRKCAKLLKCVFVYGLPDGYFEKLVRDLYSTKFLQRCQLAKLLQHYFLILTIPGQIVNLFFRGDATWQLLKNLDERSFRSSFLKMSSRQIRHLC